jgi:hypothetical protein
MFPSSPRLSFARLFGVACVLVLATIVGCGPSIPSRFVVERDIGHLAYRRYQRVLDVELAIEGNAAEGHTATYVRRTGTDIEYVNAFVTVYTNPAGLAAEVRRLVRSLASYDVTVVDVGGRVFQLDAGEGDRWVLWVSGARVVKVGGTASDALTREVIDEYLSIYPSDLDENGRARSGTLSEGDASEASSGDDDMPATLRSEEEASEAIAPDGVAE